MKKNTIIAIANQKGGAGKTTSAMNIGVILRQKGFKVLLIDLDPQNSLSTTYLKHEYNPEQATISELMSAVINRETIDTKKYICYNEANEIDYIPSDIRLSAIERQLVVTRYAETVLMKAFSKVKFDYDFTIIDCPPALSLLLYNALCAADYVLVPVLSQIMALDSVPMLLDTINEVKDNANENLDVIGYITTAYNETKMSKEVENALKENFNSLYLGHVSQAIAASYSSDKGLALSMYKETYDNQKYNQLAREYSQIVDKMLAHIKSK